MVHTPTKNIEQEPENQVQDQTTPAGLALPSYRTFEKVILP